MDRWKHEARAQAMYELYQSGKSLAEVGRAYGVSRQTVYDMFQIRGLELRSRPAPLPAVHFNGRKYTMRNVGYYGATTGNRSLLHRDVWEHHHGPIPPDHDIHHRDHDRTNNDLANLECLSKADHARLYPGRQNQFTKPRRVA